MSNLEDHLAEQAEITAAFDAEPRDILDWLDSVQVCAPGMWENETGPLDWFAVVNDQGIIAYFGDETDALRFRLDYINRKMNP